MGCAGADAPACGYGAAGLIGFIDQLPPWVSALTSVAAFFVAAMAYIRSAPKIWPIVWLTIEGRGAKGARVGIHIRNETDATVKLNSIKVASRGASIAGLYTPPNYRTTPLTEDDFAEFLSAGTTIPPKSSKSLEFTIKVDSGEVALDDVFMSISISAMRLAKRNTVMLIPIDIPENSTAASPNS